MNGRQMNTNLKDLILSCFKNKQEIMGRGGNLRKSEKICVLLKRI